MQNIVEMLDLVWVRAQASLVRDEEGQGLIEYVLIGALISIVAILAMRGLGGPINTLWGNISGALAPAP